MPSSSRERIKQYRQMMQPDVINEELLEESSPENPMLKASATRKKEKSPMQMLSISQQTSSGKKARKQDSRIESI